MSDQPQLTPEQALERIVAWEEAERPHKNIPLLDCAELAQHALAARSDGTTPDECGTRIPYGAGFLACQREVGHTGDHHAGAPGTCEPITAPAVEAREDDGLALQIACDGLREIAKARGQIGGYAASVLSEIEDSGTSLPVSPAPVETPDSMEWFWCSHGGRESDYFHSIEEAFANVPVPGPHPHILRRQKAGLSGDLSSENVLTIPPTPEATEALREAVEQALTMIGAIRIGAEGRYPGTVQGMDELMAILTPPLDALACLPPVEEARATTNIIHFPPSKQRPDGEWVGPFPDLGSAVKYAHKHEDPQCERANEIILLEPPVENEL
jgi:hypothetical protein